MPLRQIIFAILFGVVVAVVFHLVLGGELIVHLLVTVPAALLGGWFASRRQMHK